MFGLPYQKQHWGPIGLDLNRRCIRMVQLCTTREGLVLAAAHERRVPAGEWRDHPETPWLSTLRRMLEEYDFHGTRVVVGCPPELLKITPVRLNEADDEQSQVEGCRQAAWRLGWDSALYTIESLPAGRVIQQDQTKMELILMAAENQGVRSLLEQLDQVDVEVVGLEPIACAIFRNARRCMQRKGESNQLTVFVDVGYSYTHVVFVRGEDISFVKQIPLGTRHFLREITQKLDIDDSQAELLRAKAHQQSTDSDTGVSQEGVMLEQGIRQAVMDADMAVAEALCHELGLCIRYYTVTFRGQRIQRVMFSGGEGEEGVLLDVMKHAMHVSIQPMDAFEGLTCLHSHRPATGKEGSRSWGVATGLALKGLLYHEDPCESLTGDPKRALITI